MVPAEEKPIESASAAAVPVAPAGSAERGADGADGRTRADKPSLPVGERRASAPAALTRPLLAGAAMMVLGIAIAGVAPIRGTDVREDRTHVEAISGGFLVVAGWLFLGFGIHRFGRAFDRE